MATVRTDAYQLPLPAGWSDRTAVTIVAPAAPDGSVPNEKSPPLRSMSEK